MLRFAIGAFFIYSVFKFMSWAAFRAEKDVRWSEITLAREEAEHDIEYLSSRRHHPAGRKLKHGHPRDVFSDCEACWQDEWRRN